MPIITVKVFEGELTWGQTAEMIEDITEAVIPYVGEVVRSNTWVLVEEVKSGSWGIGGKAFGLPDLRQIQQSAPRDQQPHSRRPPKPNAEGDRIG
jgi:4-oxalocrotonate tautomerase